MKQDIFVALQIYGIGMVISAVIALTIKGLSSLLRRFAKE